MYILGIDPSQRHTGLCLRNTLSGAPPLFKEVKGLGAILPSLQQIRNEVRTLLDSSYATPKDLTVIIEKQGYAGKSAQTLFAVEMSIMDGICAYLMEKGGTRALDDFTFMSPLPVQLESYMKKVELLDISSKSTIVEGYKKQYEEVNKTGRISSHLVEAFFLTRLAQGVLEKKWRYNPTSTELPRYSWKTVVE